MSRLRSPLTTLSLLMLASGGLPALNEMNRVLGDAAPKKPREPTESDREQLAAAEAKRARRALRLK